MNLSISIPSDFLMFLAFIAAGCTLGAIIYWLTGGSLGAGARQDIGIGFFAGTAPAVLVKYFGFAHWLSLSVTGFILVLLAVPIIVGDRFRHLETAQLKTNRC